MIITVTLNPALDKTARVDVLRPNDLNRLRDLRLDAGGKGVNVSAMIRALGGESVAVGFAGGGAGDELLSLIAGKGIKADFVRTAAATRINLKVIVADGALTELNEPGPEISAAEWRMMEQKLSGYAVAGNIAVLSGSLPAGLGADTYRNLAAMLRSHGTLVFLDAGGEAFALALEGGPGEVPAYIKPNRYELLEYAGIRNDEDVSEAKLLELCETLLDRGIKLAALSLGESGALFVSRSGAWRAPALPVQACSPVGAGDSMTGALAYGLEKGLPEEQCFSLALAASAGACTTEGTNPPDRALVDRLLTQVTLQKIA
jgi:1-phosphofructokinase